MSLREPSTQTLAELARSASSLDMSYPATGSFRAFDYSETVGHGIEALAAGQRTLETWSMHAGAGIRTTSPTLEPGANVGLATQVMGLWLAIACRVVDVTSTDQSFGFTYNTLPGHPEQGQETFEVAIDDDELVSMKIHGVTRPAIVLNRLIGPIGNLLQDRFTKAYFDSMRANIAQP